MFDSIATQNAEIRTVANSLPPLLKYFAKSLFLNQLSLTDKNLKYECSFQFEVLQRPRVVPYGGRHGLRRHYGFRAEPVGRHRLRRCAHRGRDRRGRRGFRYDRGGEDRVGRIPPRIGRDRRIQCSRRRRSFDRQQGSLRRGLARKGAGERSRRVRYAAHGRAIYRVDRIVRSLPDNETAAPLGAAVPIYNTNEFLQSARHPEEEIREDSDARADCRPSGICSRVIVCQPAAGRECIDRLWRNDAALRMGRLRAAALRPQSKSESFTIVSFSRIGV